MKNRLLLGVLLTVFSFPISNNLHAAARRAARTQQIKMQAKQKEIRKEKRTEEAQEELENRMKRIASKNLPAKIKSLQAQTKPARVIVRYKGKQYLLSLSPHDTLRNAKIAAKNAIEGVPKKSKSGSRSSGYTDTLLIDLTVAQEVLNPAFNINHDLPLNNQKITIERIKDFVKEGSLITFNARFHEPSSTSGISSYGSSSSTPIAQAQKFTITVQHPEGKIKWKVDVDKTGTISSLKKALSILDEFYKADISAKSMTIELDDNKPIPDDAKLEKFGNDIRRNEPFTLILKEGQNYPEAPKPQSVSPTSKASAPASPSGASPGSSPSSSPPSSPKASPSSASTAARS